MSLTKKILSIFMSSNKEIQKLCPDNDPDCLQRLKEACPTLDEECLKHIPSQMDYYLVGRENYNVRYFDNEYLRLCKQVIENGTWVYNSRTQKRCLTYIGASMRFDMEGTNAFPLLTTKKMAYKALIGELLGFIRGFDNAQQFRELNCKIWDANANVTEQWLKNENRKGEDDLGRIYGVQAREWRGSNGETVDQLQNVIDRLNLKHDDRRLIVSHWKPDELPEMALPPCHLLYQFHITDETLHLTMYQRSADLPLGVPFNIASYALLLRLIAQITGLKCGSFTHFLGNVHIYEDQLEGLETQISRKPNCSPNIIIDENIQTLEDLETWVIPDNIKFEGYVPYDAIKFPFSA